MGHRPVCGLAGRLQVRHVGPKAAALAQWARCWAGFLSLRSSGHGESGGDFPHGTIRRWRRALAVLPRPHCDGPQVLVGSSMGGWMALLLVRELRKRLRAAGRIALPATLAGIGAGRAGDGFHRSADVGAASRRTIKRADRTEWSCGGGRREYGRRSLFDHRQVSSRRWPPSICCWATA